jgi:pimeloyl-ACP methyl ester carboxylesterase
MNGTSHKIRTDDGYLLHAEEFGRGTPIIFAHEFGGDHRSWQSQIAAFAKNHRCIIYAARGFLPSDVPASVTDYGEGKSTQDLIAVADRLRIARFHLVGLSMGSFTSLMAAAQQPWRILSLTLIGCSSGPCNRAARAEYRAYIGDEIARLEAGGATEAVAWFARKPAYRRMREKAPARWKLYLDHLRRQSVDGALRTLKTVHLQRICLRRIRPALALITAPTLLVYGEEDHRYVAPANKFLTEVIPNTSVAAFPRTGHMVNIEEAAKFNRLLRSHIVAADGERLGATLFSQ